MLGRLALAVVVAVVVTLGCLLLGAILIALKPEKPCQEISSELY